MYKKLNSFSEKCITFVYDFIERYRQGAGKGGDRNIVSRVTMVDCFRCRKQWNGICSIFDIRTSRKTIYVIFIPLNDGEKTHDKRATIDSIWFKFALYLSFISHTGSSGNIVHDNIAHTAEKDKKNTKSSVASFGNLNHDDGGKRMTIHPTRYS
jgi:hypothetical protein